MSGSTYAYTTTISLPPVAQAKRHESLLVDRIGILSGKSEGVLENCDRFRETDAMGPLVCVRLPRSHSNRTTTVYRRLSS
jgi:hypothetical protein